MEPLSEELKSQIRELKKSLLPDEVLIKNEFGKNIQKVKHSKWKEIQSHIDASAWERLDNKV